MLLIMHPLFDTYCSIEKHAVDDMAAIRKNLIKYVNRPAEPGKAAAPSENVEAILKTVKEAPSNIGGNPGKAVTSAKPVKEAPSNIGGNPGKAVTSAKPGFGWGSLIGNFLAAYFLWPYLKDLAYTVGIAQPFVGLRQLSYRKPVDWGILRDQAVERIANTRYILPKAEF